VYNARGFAATAVVGLAGSTSSFTARPKPTNSQDTLHAYSLKTGKNN
jgi:hypothetical protein